MIYPLKKPSEEGWCLCKRWVLTYGLSTYNFILMERPTLITEEYRSQNALLHQANQFYGAGGEKEVNLFKDMIARTNTESVLDYGCGKGEFGRQLKTALPTVKVVCYDPAIKKYDKDPPPCDLVFCFDVMEHIEPKCINDVLAHLASKTLKAAIVTVSMCKAKKTLPDGRNAHLLLKPLKWWLKKLGKYFQILYAKESNGSTHAEIGLKPLTKPPKPPRVQRPS